MNDLKYLIIVYHGMTERSARAIIFNGHLSHKDAAPDPKIATTIRGGFCTVYPSIEAFGTASSLGLKSDPKKDVEIIKATLNRDMMLIP